MKNGILVVIGSIVGYAVCMLTVGYIKTKSYKPNLSNAWEDLDNLDSKVTIKK